MPCCPSAEDLFLSFIGTILHIDEEFNDLSILVDSTRPYIIDETNIIVNASLEEFKANINVTEEINYCMGHGGIIDEKKRNICKICYGELCKICLEAFFICPGSLNLRDIHKFTLKNAS